MAEIEPKISSYLHAKGARLGIPVSGTFELTRKCNFNCKMCYVHTTDTSKDKELTTEEWLKIAETVKNEGLLFLLITGGEPLLRPDFSVLYTELSKMGFMISVNTNGSLITDEIFSLFEKYPPARVNVSLYGGSEEKYESLCENRKFSVVKRNIEKLKKMGISVRLNCVFNKYNADDAEKIYSIANELGVIIKASSYMYPPLRAKGETGENEARLNPEEAAECELLCRRLTYSDEQLRENAKKLQFLEMPDCGCDSEGDTVRCRAGKSSFWITYDGKMTPCGMMTEPAVSLKDTDFKNAWQQIRNETAKIRLPSECQNCLYKNVCSVCAAMCYTETGKFDGKPEYICRMFSALADEYVKQYGKDGE